MGVKKEAERLYLELLRRSIDDFPTGAVEDSESPDFLISSPEHILGVEGTRIFGAGEPGSPPRQARDTECDLIAECAQAIASDRALPPVVVDIYFSSTQSLGKHCRDSVAKQIVEFVAANIPAHGSRRTPPRYVLHFENRRVC